MILNDHQDTQFNVEYLRNGTRYRKKRYTNRDLHTPYSKVSFWMSLMTLSDLAKYLMIRSMARFLCESWASCYSMSATRQRKNSPVFTADRPHVLLTVWRCIAGLRTLQNVQGPTSQHCLPVGNSACQSTAVQTSLLQAARQSSTVVAVECLSPQPP